MSGYCTNCKVLNKTPKGHLSPPNGERTWWNLSGYYGISGYFCPTCFDKVYHQDGVPMFPDEYKVIAVKQRLKAANQT